MIIIDLDQESEQMGLKPVLVVLESQEGVLILKWVKETTREEQDRILDRLQGRFIDL